MEKLRNLRTRLGSSDKLEDKKNKHEVRDSKVSSSSEGTKDQDSFTGEPTENAKDDTVSLHDIIASSQAVDLVHDQFTTTDEKIEFRRIERSDHLSELPEQQSGYFSDSAADESKQTNKKRRHERAKTTSPIPKFFRKSRLDKSENDNQLENADDQANAKTKKESIYSRLVKSTKRDESTPRQQKEPLYARIKPKTTNESSSTSDKATETVKPEPIYSRFKSKILHPFKPSESHLESSSTLSESTDVVTSTASRQPSNEPIYSVIKTKNKSLERAVSPPKDKINSETKNKQEPIYNQPLPDIPMEETKLSKVTVKSKEITSSKPSMATLGGSPKPRVLPPAPPTESPKMRHHSSPNPSQLSPSSPRLRSRSPKIDSPRLPTKTPLHRLKSDDSLLKKKASSTVDSEEALTISRSSLGTDLTCDSGERTRLSKLVEELAQELESVSRRTGLHESADEAQHRETLMKLLSAYDVPKNLRPVGHRLPHSVSPHELRHMDDSEGMVYADVPDYSQDEFFIALDDENNPKYASMTRDMRLHDESPAKVSRPAAQMYVNVVSVLSALKVLINSNSTKAATVINRMGTIAKPYANKMQNSISETSWIQRKIYHKSGHNGFDELRRYIKSGGEFCKELAVIMQERAELEASYAKSLHKLSMKLLKSSRENLGTVSDAWQAVGSEMEHEGDVHRILASALTDDVVRPLRQLIESQYKIRKGVEGIVDKTTKNLQDWRVAEAKAKKTCYHNTRENEKVQDMLCDARLGRGKPMTDKDIQKLEKQRKKAEDAVQKSDLEYYTFCVRAERSRQDWESAIYKGSNCFQTLEEERLAALKKLVVKYSENRKDIAPKLVACAERLEEPVASCDVHKDIQMIIAAKGTGENCPEQNLPDFYSEDFNNPMNKSRRRESLEKFSKWIKTDLDRELRGKKGVENLAKALQETPNFGGEESQQDVHDKLQHMKAMLAYLEASRYKTHRSLEEVNDQPHTTHPLAKHIDNRKDKLGYSSSVLKVPAWVKGHSTDVSPISESASSSPNWNDRGTADGNSVQPDSDFVECRQFMYPARYPSLNLPTDEFSNASDQDYQNAVNDFNNAPINTRLSNDQLDCGVPDGTYYARPLNIDSRCKALYDYEANLYDELTIKTGDIINVHDKQPDGWWVGELDGKIGIFPATYVENIEFP